MKIIKEDEIPGSEARTQWASKEGQEKLVDCLIQTQADIIKAAENGQSNLVEFLIRVGGDVNSRNGDGWTPIYHVSLLFH